MPKLKEKSLDEKIKYVLISIVIILIGYFSVKGQNIYDIVYSIILMVHSILYLFVKK